MDLTIESSSSDNKELKVLFFDLTNSPSYIKFIITTTIVVLGFMIAGIIQEYIFVSYPNFEYGFFLTLCQFIIYAICAALERFFFTNNNNKKERHPEMLMHSSESGYFTYDTTSPSTSSILTSKSENPSTPTTTITNNMIFTVNNNNNSTFQHFKYYFLLASTMVLGMGLGNESMTYLNYPTKILFKSCKLLITMFVGVLILGKRYKSLDYIASIFLILGLYTLYNANQSVNLQFDSTGVTLITCALLFDSIASNIQDKLLRELDRSENELIYYSYLIGSIFLFFLCILVDQFIPAIQFCMEYPSVFGLMIAYSLVGYIGALYVNKMIKLFGILVTLTTTCSRKVLSILISYLIFPKPMVFNHLLAISLVFVGVFIRVYCKNKDGIDRAIKRFFGKKELTSPIPNKDIMV